MITERLRLLRAGASVEVPAHYLPEDCRPRLMRRAGFGLRALVTSDGVVSFRSETAGEWLAENGLDT